MMKKFSVIILFNISVITLLFLFAELLYRHQVLTHSVFEDEPYFEYDGKLGWVPKPGNYEEQGDSITITPDRFRSVSKADVKTEGRTILACGDSFTFCNYISDEETWPYYLSRILHCRVVNAGVSGYGLDQSVLRMQEVMDEITPDLVILSLIYDDIPRCQLSRRIHYKPYFILKDGVLQLHNQPVPLPTEVVESTHWYENILIFRDLKRKILDDQSIAHQYDIVAHREGMPVAKQLCKYAARIAREKGAALIIVIQPNRPFPYKRESVGAEELAAAIRSYEIPLLNLFPVWQEEFQGKEEEGKMLFDDVTGHMSAKGNRWVAEEIAKYIDNLRNRSDNR